VQSTFAHRSGSSPAGEVDPVPPTMADAAVSSAPEDAIFWEDLADPAPPSHWPGRHGRRRVPSRASRLWAGLSMLLTAAAVAAVVLVPGEADAPPPARLAIPAAVEPPIGAEDGATPAARAPNQGDGPLQLAGSDPVRVQIPALGAVSDVIDVGLEADGSMEVVRGAYPVGWYEPGPSPGELGAAVLAGHVDWDGDRGAFYGLRELRRGDIVVVDRADGTAATFQVDRVEEHAKAGFPTEDVYGEIDHAGLRLITCGGIFDEDAGSYRNNVIVFASLIAR
jgi:hypothetical protein